MRTKTIKVKATTNNITKGIVNLLLKDGHSASRVNTTGIWDERLQLFRKTGARKGFYDIAATIKSKFTRDGSIPLGITLMIDTKRGKDDLSEDQIKFRDEILNAGGLTFESKNYNDFEAWYYEFLKPIYIDKNGSN